MNGISLPVITKPSGIVLYHGPSQFDGKKIVVIATGFEASRSGNEKTGAVIQTWIMIDKEQPITANNKGLDSSVCGNCKHRHFRSCYVNIANGPYQVYQAWKDGKYPEIPLGAASYMFRGLFVRLGSFGDPASVPINVWKSLTSYSAGWLGYTHQWKRCDTSYRQFCMASSDTIEEAQDAMKMGWKPFFVRRETDSLPQGFFECPASAEQGKRLSCDQCGVCKGGKYRKGQGMPSIVAHGPSWKKIYFEKGMKLMRNKKKFVGVFTKA